MELLARSVIDNLNRLIVPNTAGPARVVPLKSLATPELTYQALRQAAAHGRLEATYGADGTWRCRTGLYSEWMPNPFDDPAVRSAFGATGVVHSPGMADELLKEVAPLLAAEGIDLDDPSSYDLATVSAALARAVERRNFDRFTAFGETRADALTALRLTSEAFAAGSMHLVEAVVYGVEPEPTEPGKASVAQVIGVCLGMLDTWHSDSTLSGSLARARMPKWNSRARAAATDILALARKGRAFDSIGTLHRRHSGLAILEGGVLAVAGTLEAWAASENQSVRNLGAAVLATSE